MKDPMKYDLPDELTVDADGPVRAVLINRAAELNCVNENLHWALANVWRQLAADREAKVVILSGAGRAFCAGGDLNWSLRFSTIRSLATRAFAKALRSSRRCCASRCRSSRRSTARRSGSAAAWRC
jgi:enoyl-CoA hydratase/carnithine racemase